MVALRLDLAALGIGHAEQVRGDRPASLTKPMVKARKCRSVVEIKFRHGRSESE